MGPEPFSHGCVAQGQHVMGGVGLPPFLPHRHGEESNAFSWKALNGSGVFSFSQLSLWVNSFIRFSCRVAWVCGNTGAIALHIQSPKCCLSLCFPHAGTALQQHCGLKFLFCSQECQNQDSRVGAAFGHVFVYTSCCSVQIQKNFCSSGPKFYFIQCFQH